VATLVESTVIHAPPERVYDYRLALENLPRYNGDVSDLARAAGEPPTWRFRVRLAPGVRWPCRLTVVEAARPHRIRFAMESLMRAEEVCTFEPVPSLGPSGVRMATRLRFETTVATPGGPLAPLLDAAFVVPVARKQIRRELQSMKRQLDEW
jgi:uncharacterized membrane protein